MRSETSTTGFSASCLPGFCPEYAVAIIDGNISLIDSKSLLLEFLGLIDSPAELDIWLWAHELWARFHQQTESGYLAVVAWDDYCGTRGEDLVHISKNGTITKQYTISRETYEACA